MRKEATTGSTPSPRSKNALRGVDELGATVRVPSAVNPTMALGQHGGKLSARRDLCDPGRCLDHLDDLGRDFLDGVRRGAAREPIR